jgi:hypothetical protein
MDASTILVEFVYDRIKTQREKALEIMNQTAERGIEDARAFEDAIVQYFDSSYLPELRELSKNYSMTDVVAIIRSTENATAKISHLLGACNRLIPEVPDNAAFRILRAYAIDVLNYNEEAVDQELREAYDLLIRQGKQITEIHSLFRQLRSLMSMTQERCTSFYDRCILQYHLKRLEELNRLVN